MELHSMNTSPEVSSPASHSPEAVRALDQLTVRRCTVAELEQSPEFADLIAEYTAEASTAGPNPDLSSSGLYRQLEETGALVFIAAFIGAELVGFVALLNNALPHFGRVVSTTELLFVRESARRSGAGTALRQAAEAGAKEFGSVGIYIAAPVGGRLQRVLPRCGYSETYTSFFKEF